MKIQRLKLAAALAFAFGMLALNAQQETKTAGLTGNWTLSLHGDHVIPAGLVLKQDGDKLSGTLMLMDKEIPLTGEIIDGAVTLNGDAKLLGHGGEDGSEMPKLKITGKLLADGTMAGKLPGPHGEMEWTAERLKERKARPAK